MVTKNLVRHVINKDLGCFDHETGRVDCATIPNSVNVFMCLTRVKKFNRVPGTIRNPNRLIRSSKGWKLVFFSDRK